MKMLSMKATCSHSHGQLSSYFLGWEEYQKNPYHPLYNPSGIIQMGLAENQLSLEIVESWVEKNSDVSGFKENGVSIFTDLALFQDYHGLPSLKKALAELMSEMRGNRVRFDEKKVVLTAGATSASETLIFCIADPGQAFLIPTPYYPGFDRDLKWRTGVELVPIHCSSLNNFRITQSALEDAYNRAQGLNLKVKGVIITNPSNPLGTTMTKHELNHLITFAVAKDIHIVSDEVYSGSVFNSPNFISIMEVAMNNLHHYSDILNRVHVIYSLSKDFGLPGFRVGVVYSNNEILLSAATKMSSFGLVSAQTQFLLSNLIGDEKFRKFYIKENRKRIKKRQRMFVLGLENTGIRCLKSNAGLFCWVDMRHLLESNTFEGEIEVWKKFIYQVGLNISPGSSCHCIEPGWFRMCFANMSEETLNVALSRVKAFVDSVVWSTRRLTNKWVVQFQLSQCERDEQR